MSPLARRDFVRLTALAGGGLLVSVALPACVRNPDAQAAPVVNGAGDAGPALAGASAPAAATAALTAYFRIEPDGAITVLAPKIGDGSGHLDFAAHDPGR